MRFFRVYCMEKVRNCPNVAESHPNYGSEGAKTKDNPG